MRCTIVPESNVITKTLAIRNRRRFAIVDDRIALELILRLYAMLRFDSVSELPPVVLLPWKSSYQLSSVCTPTVPEFRKETKRRSRRLSQRCGGDALLALLDESEREAAQLRERLLEAETELQRHERRRSRSRREAEEMSQRIDVVVDRCRKLLDKESPAASPVGIVPESQPLTDSPPVNRLPDIRSTPKQNANGLSLESVEQQIRCLRQEVGTPIRTGNNTPSSSDVHPEMRRLREENSALRLKLESPESPSCGLLSPALSDISSTPNSSSKLSSTHEIDEIRMTAFKEVLIARSRADALTAEVEQLRNYKSMVRDWVCSFVTQKETEKATLVESLHAARHDARDAEALRIQLATESRARATAEASLSALRAHQAQLARELAKRSNELASARAEMNDARDTYTRMTNITQAEMAQFQVLASTQQNLSKRNLSLRSQVTALQHKLDTTTAHLTTERDRLQESLANMANLANSTQTRLATVERQLANERAKNWVPTPPSPTSTLRRQVGRVLKVPGSPKKKKKPTNGVLADKVNCPTVELADTRHRARSGNSQLRDIQNFV